MGLSQKAPPEITNAKKGRKIAMLQNALSSRAVIGKRRDRGFSPCAEGSFIIENMRTLADGSAVLREGYSYRFTLPAAPRALLEATGEAAGCVYMIAGNGFYLVDPENKSCTLLAETGSSSGNASLFRCGGKIYILDGGELKRYDGEGGLTVEEGYVPLYGNRWNPLSRGSVNEPMNLLTRKIRINYRVPELSYRLVTGLTLASVESFELNGKLLSADDNPKWSLDASGRFITTTGLNTEDSVTICATVAADTLDRTALTSCTAAAAFGDCGSTRICCFDGLDPAKVFVSKPVDDESLAASRRHAEAAGELYFPTDGKITVGDGGYTVTAIAECRGEMLIFNEKETYRLECGSSRSPSAELIDGTSGVTKRDCAATCSGGTVAVCGDGIYYRKSSGRTSDKSAGLISDGMPVHYPISGISSVTSDSAKDEVWFCAPDDQRGRALLWNAKTGCFYCFTDVYADRIFTAGESICFMRGSDVYGFDPALLYDTEPDGASGSRAEPIEGFIESPFFDLGSPGRQKRIHHASLDVRGGSAVLTLIADTGRTASVCFPDAHRADAPQLRGKPNEAAARVNTGAFYSMKYRISVSGPERPRICGVSLTARK